MDHEPGGITNIAQRDTDRIPHRAEPIKNFFHIYMRHKKSDSRPFRHKMRIDVTRLTYANAHPYCRSYYNSKSIPFQIPLSTSASSRTEALVYVAEAESMATAYDHSPQFVCGGHLH